MGYFFHLTVILLRYPDLIPYHTSQPIKIQEKKITMPPFSHRRDKNGVRLNGF